VRVAIVGGGWAGLAAAVTLADAGIPHTVFEAAKTLGGRARRVEVDGRVLDNGLHILIGAYRETLALVRKVAPTAEPFRRLPLTLEIADRFRLTCPKLPAPFHLLAGLARARGLDWADRLAAARFMIGQRAGGFRARAGETVAALLERTRQSRRDREYLWEPLCIAALNTQPAEADAQVFLNVVRDGLGSGRGASDLVLPTTDFGAMLPDPAADYVGARSGTIRTGCAVRSIARARAGFVVRTGEDETSCTHVICATDPARAASLWGGLPELAALAATVDRFRYLPIVSIYLQYAANVRLSSPMLGFVEGPAQWAFDRGTLCGQHGLIGAVASAAVDIDRMSGDALATTVDAQLRRHIPGLPVPEWHRVITERRATFACVPGMSRPLQRTALPRFFLAGDYTASDYPATLEAAVHSGIACAQAVLEDR
jgi:squalene-associated FAD-dependent desaturase